MAYSGWCAIKQNQIKPASPKCSTQITDSTHYDYVVLNTVCCSKINTASRKLFKLDEPDMQDTAGEAETNS